MDRNDPDITFSQLFRKVAKPRRHIILWLALLLVFIGIAWSAYFKIDEVVFAEGKVVPFQKIQLIQSLDGGIVKKLFVHEGQLVEKDQDLIEIDATPFLSSYRGEEAKIHNLQAKIVRLSAEVNNTKFDPSAELVKAVPAQIQSEKAQYDSRKRELGNLQSQKALLMQELNMNQSLVASGAVSKAELLRIKQSVDELEGKISKFESDTIDELNKTKAEYMSSKESIVGIQYRLTKAIIKSPVKGIVKNLYINTIGGVAKPGADIMDIVPMGDTLLIEAKVKPNDVGFLHPGLKALVKITAYDYYQYGGLNGKLEQISADSTTTEKGEIFYKVYIRTDSNHLGTPEKPLTIIPGMVATVDIISSKKSILQYLLKPVLRLQEKALHEK